MKFKRGIAASAALALLGLTAGAVSAAAVDLMIDQDEGNLYVHKYEQPNTVSTTGGDGTEAGTNTGGWTALPGVEFKAQLVTGVDLKTNDGWKLANDLVASLASATDPTAWTPVCGSPNTCGLGTAISKTTGVAPDPADLAKFEDLPVGLYLVTEGNYTGTAYQAGQIKKAKPFLVTIPLSYDNAGVAEWNYDVHVYPKNTIASIEKTVSSTTPLVQIGDAVSFDISTTVPAGDLDSYVVTDPIVEALSFTGVGAVKIVDGATTLETLVAADYTVTPLGASVATPVDGPVDVVVTLTPAGLAKVQAQRATHEGAKLVVTINAIVNDEAETNPVTNEANYSVNGGTPTYTTPGGKVEIGFDDQSFLKIDHLVPTEKLQGATFDVYVSSSPVWNAATATQLNHPGTSNPIVVTSNANGEFKVENLRHTSYIDGANGALTCDADTVPVNPANSPKCNFYWLVETAAPAGYQPLAAPFRFVVDGTGVINVENVSTDSITGTLPLTGMSGIIFLVLAGALVLGGSGYGLYRASRSNA